MTRGTNDEDMKVKQSFGKTEFIWLFNWSDKWSIVRYPIPSFELWFLSILSTHENFYFYPNPDRLFKYIFRKKKIKKIEKFKINLQTAQRKKRVEFCQDLSTSFFFLLFLFLLSFDAASSNVVMRNGDGIINYRTLSLRSLHQRLVMTKLEHIWHASVNIKHCTTFNGSRIALSINLLTLR